MRNGNWKTVLYSIILLYVLMAFELLAAEPINLKFTGFYDEENDREVYVLDLNPLSQSSVNGNVKVDQSTLSLFLENANGLIIGDVSVLNYSDYYGVPFVDANVSDWESGKIISVDFQGENPELALDIKDNILYMVRTDDRASAQAGWKGLSGEERARLFQDLLTAGTMLLCATGDEKSDRAMLEFVNGSNSATVDMGIMLAQQARESFNSQKNRLSFMSKDKVLRWTIPLYVSWNTSKSLVKGFWTSLTSIDDLAGGSVSSAGSCTQNLFEGNYSDAGREFSNFQTNAASLVMVLWGGKQMLSPLKAPAQNLADRAANEARNAANAVKTAAQNAANGGNPPFAGALAGGGSRAIAGDIVVEGSAVTAGTGGGNPLGGAAFMFGGDRFSGRKKGEDYDPASMAEEKSDLFDDPEAVDPDDLDDIININDDPDLAGMDPDDLRQLIKDENPEYMGKADHQSSGAAVIDEEIDDMMLPQEKMPLPSRKTNRTAAAKTTGLAGDMEAAVMETAGLFPTKNRFAKTLMMLVRARHLFRESGRMPVVLRFKGVVKNPDGTIIKKVDSTVLGVRHQGKVGMIMDGDEVLSLATYEAEQGLSEALAGQTVKMTVTDWDRYIDELNQTMSGALTAEKVYPGAKPEVLQVVRECIDEVTR